MDEIAPVAPAAPAAAPFAAKREALRESTRMPCAWCGKPLPLETGTLRIFCGRDYRRKARAAFAKIRRAAKKEIRRAHA